MPPGLPFTPRRQNNWLTSRGPPRGKGDHQLGSDRKKCSAVLLRPALALPPQSELEFRGTWKQQSGWTTIGGRPSLAWLVVDMRASGKTFIDMRVNWK